MYDYNEGWANTHSDIFMRRYNEAMKLCQINHIKVLTYLGELDASVELAETGERLPESVLKIFRKGEK